MHVDTNGNSYPTYQALTEAMLGKCQHEKADEIAAGFGHNKTKELLEFLHTDEQDRYNIEQGAADFDMWCANADEYAG